MSGQSNGEMALAMLRAIGEVVATLKGDDATGSAEGTVATVPFKVSWKPSTWREGGKFLLWLTIGGKKVSSGERFDRFSKDSARRVVEGRLYTQRQEAAKLRQGEIATRLTTILDKAARHLCDSDSDLLRLAVGHAIANGFLAKADEQGKVPA